MESNRRKWPQFSLRWVLIQVTLIGVLAGSIRATVQYPQVRELTGLLIYLWAILAGSIIGGVFGDFWRGAAGGIVLAAVLILAAIILDGLGLR